MHHGAVEAPRTVEEVHQDAACLPLGPGGADSDFKSLSGLCQKLGYDQTAFDNMIQRTVESYQKDVSVLRTPFE